MKHHANVCRWIALAAVALVQVEALERSLAVFELEAWPRVLDSELAWRRDDAHFAAARCETERILDEVRDDLEHPVGVRDRRRGAVGHHGEREPDRDRHREPDQPAAPVQEVDCECIG